MKRKLSIRRETIRNLTSGEMQGVIGGRTLTEPSIGNSVCETCYQCYSVTGWSQHSCYDLPD